ncbi:MAG: hypothetical protein A3I07_01600 [Candidatus Doudnabacteria bacterium RIFCSPLOWO2_02_FULL_42_9]|uniref:FAD/NAD(P)-binding domain-containing protein n=1 Tax=Candidatus Doudnabacteria bacterium RIFCSPHIGHO2_01_FULL_41_86 TaxID=1817821 RepID=A0A1F5N7B5_9BACT|nr:MAG: hypothetical protein A2717_02950 [Candidatus Doudnabacteria bacterium RIFCSPHIGHO2_01_FULL_41_86]OGE74654.1 MAG: hypothetical protein A3K07_02545 [Candidatus Doudnabacteria bacterium RIFCSPHIGHO2_01_43_10]OGE85013.1 MAG: hypothetical protein A3E28_04355 [Candidatus Doudnabacteria bacterium RIFCSPHIGHO2_12_FULL_42_22]OGE86454.1 MAG: hypothetical protein A3C49_04535 [Candidatus Doudnabacteria bacterium RIFCSPHIGHO2_02_FULL_42_25]OGE91916.1 MAG: hypothetical protein A2895_01300 [Candidatus
MYDVIIIGGGVAAFTAGIFTSRRGLKTLIIGKDIAGQANYTDAIENYPGLQEVGGFELVSSIRQQAENFGAEFLIAEVSKVKAVADEFIVTAFDKQYKAQSLILAYGKTPKDLGVPGEAELKGKGVTYCATCDGPLFKNKVVAVAGIGDIAAEAGLICAPFAKQVFILSKTDRLICHPALNKALFRKKNVKLLPFVQIQQLIGEGKLEKMQILDLKSGHQMELDVDGLLVELGYVVDSNFLQNIVKLDEQEQIIVNADQATSYSGIFACGDAINSSYKQAVISAGNAATAALACYDWLMRRQGGIGLTSDWNQIKRLK